MPSPPSMFLMNLGTSIAQRSVTLPPLDYGGGHYEQKNFLL